MKANRILLTKENSTKSTQIDQMRIENQKELSRQTAMANGITKYSEICFEVKTMQIKNKYYRVKVIVEGDNSAEFNMEDNQENEIYRMY